MKLRIVRALAAPTIALGIAFGANPTQAEEFPLISSLFEKKTPNLVCPANGTRIVDPKVILGGVLNAFKLNPFVLSALGSFLGLPDDAPLEEVLSEWFIWDGGPPPSDVMKKDLFDDVSDAGYALHGHLRDVFRNEPKGINGYRVELTIYDDMTPDKFIRNRKLMLRAFFRTLNRRQIDSSARLIVRCPDMPASPDRVAAARPGVNVESSIDCKRSGLTFALRGKIDDLAIPRGSPGFKKASAASFGLTDNIESGTFTAAIDAVAGLGVTSCGNQRFFGFVGFKYLNVETDDPDDDDDAKDVTAFSPGVIWSTILDGRSDNPDAIDLLAYFGTSLHGTIDTAQDSTSFAGRVFIKDITFSLPFKGGAGICGGPKPFLGKTLYYSCALETFAEGGHVFDAGTNRDFATLEDDQYFGAGGEAGLSIGGFPGTPLSNITLAASYRYMGIFSGKLDNPARFEGSLSVKIPDTTAAFAIEYIDGQNFLTFADEEIVKASLKLKF